MANLTSMVKSEELSSLKLPSGQPYVSSIMTIVKVDDRGNLHIPVNKNLIIDYNIHADKFLSINNSPEYVHVEIPKYKHLIKVDDCLSGIVTSLYDVENMSDVDLAMYCDVQKDCECMMTQVKTKWSEDWLKLGKYEVRSHRFHTRTLYIEALKLLKNKTVKAFEPAYFYQPSTFMDISGNISCCNTGITKVRLSERTPEEVSITEQSKGLTTTITKSFEVTDGRFSVLSTFGLETVDSADLSIENGTYTAVVTTNLSNHSPSQIILCVS